MYVMCDPWCYTWLYVTGECILHVTVRYMRLYVTFELCCMWLYVTCDYMLCVNVWYMRLYVTCDCMVYLNVCYMWLYVTRDCMLHVTGCYVWTCVTFEYVLQTLNALLYVHSHLFLIPLYNNSDPFLWQGATGLKTRTNYPLSDPSD